MANVTSTTSNTIVALLGTVQSTAESAAKIIDTAASSVDMLDRFVQRAKNNQIIAHKVEDHTWRDNLIMEAARNQERIHEEYRREYQSQPDRVSKFNELVTDYQSLFTETQS